MPNPIDQAADYSALLALLKSIVQGEAGASLPPGQEWRNDRQTIAKKFVFHLESIRTLSEGCFISAGETTQRQIDHGSVATLGRAVVENLIVFAYVFGQEDDDLHRFRNLAWRLHGLVKRQSRPAITPAGHATHVAERPQVERIKAELRQHPALKTLTASQQRALLDKADWMTGKKLADLAEPAGLNEVYFRTVYSYLSDYAHSAYAAVLQVGQADLTAQAALTRSVLGIMNYCMAQFIRIYVPGSERGRATLDASPTGLTLERWTFAIKSMAEIYSRRLS